MYVCFVVVDMAAGYSQDSFTLVYVSVREAVECKGQIHYVGLRGRLCVERWRGGCYVLPW